MIIGIVIADEMEFIPFKEAAKQQAEPVFDYLSETMVEYYDEDSICECVFGGEGGASYRIIAVKCGIGKVNAAYAATMLATQCNVDFILNIGLSGAVKGVKRGDIAIGESYTEADIDVSPLGYKKGIKPGEETNIYNTCRPIFGIFNMYCEEAVCGGFGCGDFFLAGETKKFYQDNFDIVAFDMETGAIACICNKLGVPFQSVRKISDDSDDCKDQYNEMNQRKEQHLSDILFNTLRKNGHLLLNELDLA